MSVPCDIVHSMTKRANPDAGTKFLRPGQASVILGVHPRTLMRWAEQGMLRYHVLPSGHRRYSEQDVKALQERGAA